MPRVCPQGDTNGDVSEHLGDVLTENPHLRVVRVIQRVEDVRGYKFLLELDTGARGWLDDLCMQKFDTASDAFEEWTAQMQETKRKERVEAAAVRTQRPRRSSNGARRSSNVNSYEPDEGDEDAADQAVEAVDRTSTGLSAFGEMVDKSVEPTEPFESSQSPPEPAWGYEHRAVPAAEEGTPSSMAGIEYPDEAAGALLARAEGRIFGSTTEAAIFTRCERLEEALEVPVTSVQIKARIRAIWRKMVEDQLI
ncbi:hypothetical protein AB1Y20_009234 [Prymnesium parvum]|uniref:Uncharacterized protein n=1 Tax=Prymnesium parvum TaxID=97485 RepID=A0AB34K3T3_PRYPA